MILSAAAEKKNEHGYPIPNIDPDGVTCALLKWISDNQPDILQEADKDLKCLTFFGCELCHVVMHYFTSYNERLGLQADNSAFDELADLHSGGTAC